MMNKVLFGIDIGGTTVKCGLFTLNGELLEKSEIPTDKQDNGSRILSDVAAHIRNILEKRHLTISDVAGVGIGVPGAVTPDGIVNKCVNLGWDIKDVAKEMQTFLPVFVKVGNDANMAALGEFWKGSAKGYQSVMLVTVGTGVGGGLIIDGKPVYMVRRRKSGICRLWKANRNPATVGKKAVWSRQLPRQALYVLQSGFWQQQKQNRFLEI